MKVQQACPWFDRGHDVEAASSCAFLGLGSDMIVCLCYGISDSQIKNIIKEGATDIDAIQSKCSAGTSCGSCLEFLNVLIDEAAATDTIPAPFIFPQAEPQGNS